MRQSGYISALWFTRATLIATALVTLGATAALWSYDAMAAKGVLIGGVAGATGFWMLSRRAAALVTIPKAEIPYRVYRWTFGRMMVYAAALIWAYLVDPAGNHALVGAAAGLFGSRVVMIVTGLMAWRHRA